MKQLTDRELETIWAHYATMAPAGVRRVACMRAAIAADREINGITGEAQPAREWVGLDWSEIDDIANKNPAVGGIGAVWPYAFAADLSAKLREKNAGQPVVKEN